MHGNVRLLVCVECGCTAPLTADVAKTLRAQQRVPCTACGHEAMRFKVMMYEDAESESCLTHRRSSVQEDFRGGTFGVWEPVWQHSATRWGWWGGQLYWAAV